MTTLHRVQRAALDAIEQYARARRARAQRSIAEVLQMSNLPTAAWEEAVSKVKACARVALHFHPDRPVAAMQTVAESLLGSGVYKSQFETQISNGSVSAFPGGSRYLWESRMFGGAYASDDTHSVHRPKYGALDLLQHPDGPAPRFGSCYLLLKPGVTRRCSFTYLDSHQDPRERGTLEELDDVLAAPLTEAFVRSFTLGERDITPGRLVQLLSTRLGAPLDDRLTRVPSRNLDHYIEAQVHGDVLLGEDVEALAADPSFQSTDTGNTLSELSRCYGFRLVWHAGFRLAVDDVPDDFRGPGMPSLAKRISMGGHVDAHALGQAAMSLRLNPQAWSSRGRYEDVLQELKLLWHVLVRFGGPQRGRDAHTAGLRP